MPRVLFFRPDHLGDVLLSLPSAAALRTTAPDAHIAYAVEAGLEDVVAHCPHVHEILTIPPASAPNDRHVDEFLSSVQGRFDAAVLLRPADPWSGALASSGGIPVRVGFDQPPTLPFLTSIVVEPRAAHVTQLGLHLVAVLAAALGLPPPAREIRPAGEWFVLRDRERDAARSFLRSLDSAAPIVLHPGSGWPLKNWSARRWAVVGACLSEATGQRSVVVGSAQEAETVGAVVAASEGRCVGAAGVLSIGALAAVHARSRLVAGTDSGALHLAALMGAPVVGVYGPADPRVFSPVDSTRSRVVRSGVACSPCGTLERPPCGAVRDPTCITTVTPGEVLRACYALIGREAA